MCSASSWPRYATSHTWDLPLVGDESWCNPHAEVPWRLPIMLDADDPPATATIRASLLD